MFSRLVQKELTHLLLDFRFLFACALGVVLSVLSVYVGTRNYQLQLREYNAVTESNRKVLDEWLEKKEFGGLIAQGYRWNRRPEVLSPLVYGLSGKQGQEVAVQFRKMPEFDRSLFETDPVHALFGVLDLAFVVKVVFSLLVLLFTYDSVCGEKESGTLRLYASFPVPRAQIAFAKLIGSAVAVLVPFLLAFLLSAAALALSPGFDLGIADWSRVGALFVLFFLYLAVFAAFGIWFSALTEKRMVAFLSLMALWTVWLFVVPDMSVRLARTLSPVESVYAVEKKANGMRVEIEEEIRNAEAQYWERNQVEDWEALTEAERKAFLDGRRAILEEGDAKYYPRFKQLQMDRRNGLQRQQRLAMAFSSVSPLGAVSFASMDLARAGFAQVNRLEDAVNAHLIYFAEFIRIKRSQPWEKMALTDFSPFTFTESDAVAEAIMRNARAFLNLALLAVLGFAGAFVAILRYDVR